MSTTRRSLLRAVLATAVGVSVSRSALAGEEALAIVVNKQNPATSLAQNDLRPIFQTTKKNWDSGQEAIPINLLEDSPLRAEFDRVVLGLDPERVARYWTDRKVRGGARPPVRVPTTAAVLKAVAAKPGAVGYVLLRDVNASVKVVAKISGGKLLGP